MKFLPNMNHHSDPGVTTLPQPRNEGARRRLLTGVLGLLLTAGSAFAADLTMDATDRQAVKGWGVFPGYAHSNWGEMYRSVDTRPVFRDKLFELGFNYIRVDFNWNCYDPGAPNKLNLTEMEEIKRHILMGTTRGKSWIMTVWSPPWQFKTPQDTRGEVNGQLTYFNMAFKEQFAEHYATALAWLRDNGCGTPVNISLQNEPNYPVWYDGSSFYSNADDQELARRVRHWLNVKGLNSVRIAGPEGAHPGDAHFLGNGNDHWAEISSAPIDDAICHTYGGAGWDFWQFSRAPRTKWMTEFCDIDGGTEAKAAMQTTATIARDLLNLGVENWFFWNAYAPGTETGWTSDLTFGATTPKTTKLFYVLKRLWNEVTPDGSYKVRSFSSTDAAFNTGFTSDFSQRANVIGFKSAGKTVVLIANTSGSAQTVVLKGLSGSSLKRYQTTESTSSNTEMDDMGTVAVNGGISASFSVPATSVQILVSSAGIANGIYKISARHSGKSLDAFGTGNGASVGQWDFHGGANQKWKITDVGASQYKIEEQRAFRGLDVWGTNNGAAIQIWDFTGGANQKWYITPTDSGFYKVISVSSGKALDVSGVSTSNGAQIIQWDYVGGGNQQFSFQLQ